MLKYYTLSDSNNFTNSYFFIENKDKNTEPVFHAVIIGITTDILIIQHNTNDFYK